MVLIHNFSLKKELLAMPESKSKVRVLTEVINKMRFSVALPNDLPQERVQGINASLEGRFDDERGGHGRDRMGWA